MAAHNAICHRASMDRLTSNLVCAWGLHTPQGAISPAKPGPRTTPTFGHPVPTQWRHWRRLPQWLQMAKGRYAVCDVSTLRRSRHRLPWSAPFSQLCPWSRHGVLVIVILFYLSIYLFIYLSIYLFTYLFIFRLRSIYIFIFISIFSKVAFILIFKVIYAYMYIYIYI